MLSGGELQRFAIGEQVAQFAPWEFACSLLRFLFDRHCRRPRRGCVHVRRAVLVSGCKATPEGAIFSPNPSSQVLHLLLVPACRPPKSSACLSSEKCVLHPLLFFFGCVIMSFFFQGSKYIVVVEHDLSILDYLSDFICVLYGVPSAYGVVTMPFSVRDGACVCQVTRSLCLPCVFLNAGINIFLAGFVPTENLRFRAEALTFRVAEVLDEVKGGDKSFGCVFMVPCSTDFILLFPPLVCVGVSFSAVTARASCVQVQLSSAPEDASSRHRGCWCFLLLDCGRRRLLQLSDNRDAWGERDGCVAVPLRVRRVTPHVCSRVCEQARRPSSGC